MKHGKPTGKPPVPEWSHRIKAEDVSVEGTRHLLITPPPAALPAIAKRIGVVALLSLEAALDITRERGGAVLHVKGELRARAVQNCVRTLDPLETKISDTFEAFYADQERIVLFEKAQRESLSKREMMDLPILGEDEDPEALEDGYADLGELVVQYLCLAVDPFPQKDSGKTGKGNDTGEGGADKNVPLSLNPFAALKNWRPRD